MKRHFIACCMIGLCAGALAACNDFENPAVPYDEAPETPETLTPPAIDPSWNLVMMPDEGGQAPCVFVYKDKKYDALFTRTLGWNGGDGVLTTALPDGNVFWSFNDSFYGVVDGETRARGACSFPRNSIMVQKGASIASGAETDDDLVWLADYVQTSDPNAERYYQARTHIRHPKASLSDEQIAIGEIDQDFCYWAGDAVVYDDPVRGKILQMLWTGVEPGSLKNIDGCLREYSLDGEPGDGQYMSVLSTDYNFKSDGLAYGSTMFEDTEGKHIYLYTTKQVNLISRVLGHLLHVHGGLPLRPRHLHLPQRDPLRTLHRPHAALHAAGNARQAGQSLSAALVHDQPAPGPLAPGRAGLLDEQRPEQLLGQLQPRGQRRLLPPLLLPRLQLGACLRHRHG